MAAINHLDVPDRSTGRRSPLVVYSDRMLPGEINLERDLRADDGVLVGERRSTGDRRRFQGKPQRRPVASGKNPCATVIPMILDRHTAPRCSSRPRSCWVRPPPSPAGPPPFAPPRKSRSRPTRGWRRRSRRYSARRRSKRPAKTASIHFKFCITRAPTSSSSRPVSPADAATSAGAAVGLCARTGR
jgi:hypothetical protein